MTAAAIPRSTALVDAGREWGMPLTEADARVLTAQIRTSVQELLPLIRTAFQRRADLALGYASWEAYCDAELIGLRLAVADRHEAVAGLRADGMSTRAIGAALGVDDRTVRRDLEGAAHAAPEKVTGSDGKTYAASRPAPQPTPTPGPAEAPSTAPVGPGLAPVPAADAPMPLREPEPAPKPTLRLVPDVAEVLAAEQRDARALLLRVVELLSPASGGADYVETWARQLGPYDDELAELVHRAHDALSALDDLISEAGK